MFDKGSTAVLSTTEFPFIVAVKEAGIYSFEEGIHGVMVTTLMNV